MSEADKKNILKLMPGKLKNVLYYEDQEYDIKNDITRPEVSHAEIS